MTVATAPSFQPPNKSSSKPLDRLGISAHLAAAMGATVELREDFEHLHHGHGVLFLIASKIVREVNVLREELEETIDDVPGAKSRFQHVNAAVWTVLTSPTLATVFALAALYAATVEVIQDVVPGGHHGAMFLAMNELFELFVQSKLLKTTIPGGTVLQTIFENTIVKLTLCSAALLAALCEIVRSGQFHFKGHHGVAILALMKVIRCSSLVRDAWQQKQNKNKKNA